jgi:hypothetical protein
LGAFPSRVEARLLACISPSMACAEYVRLHQIYEAALRRWDQTVLSSQGTIGTAASLAAQVRKKALEERNAASERIDLHRLTCPVCSPKVRGH